MKRELAQRLAELMSSPSWMENMSEIEAARTSSPVIWFGDFPGDALPAYLRRRLLRDQRSVHPYSIELGWEEAVGLMANVDKALGDDCPATIRAYLLRARRHSLENDDHLKWPLVSAPAVAQVLHGIDSKAQPQRYKALDSLQTAPNRYLQRAGSIHLDLLEAVRADFPNFSEVIDHYAQELQLRRLTEERVQLPNILLLGPPGVGKTAFSQAIARALQFPTVTIDFASATAGFELTGSAHHWSSTSMGKVAQAWLNHPRGNAPLILIDELDKANQDGNYPPADSLLSLLEPTSARAFRDLHLDFTMDVRPTNYLFTANRKERIRRELLSRMKVIEVPLPTQEQMPAIVRSIDGGLRRDRPGLDRVFAPLAKEVIEHFAAHEPRQVKKQLEETYAKAALNVDPEQVRRQPLALRTADLSTPQPVKAQPVRSPKFENSQPVLYPEGYSKMRH